MTLIDLRCGIEDAVTLAVIAGHFTQERGREVLGFGKRDMRALTKRVKEEYLKPEPPDLRSLVFNISDLKNPGNLFKQEEV